MNTNFHEKTVQLAESKCKNVLAASRLFLINDVFIGQRASDEQKEQGKLPSRKNPPFFVFSKLFQGIKLTFCDGLTIHVVNRHLS